MKHEALVVHYSEEEGAGAGCGGGACGCVTNAGYKIDIFYKFIPEVTGVSTRRAPDPMLTGVRNRGRVNPVAPDILLKF